MDPEYSRGIDFALFLTGNGYSKLVNIYIYIYIYISLYIHITIYFVYLPFCRK